MQTDERLTTVEVARLLHLSTADVYRLIFAGELVGRPDADGVVRVLAADVDAYRRRSR